MSVFLSSNSEYNRRVDAWDRVFAVRRLPSCRIVYREGHSVEGSRKFSSVGVFKGNIPISDVLKGL